LSTCGRIFRLASRIAYKEWAINSNHVKVGAKSWRKAQAARLKKEGHKIIAGKGRKPPKVQHFEKALV